MRAQAMMMVVAVVAATGCLGGQLDPSQPTADQGWSYRYVQDGVELPTGAAAAADAPDLDGNGSPDNKLGRVLGALSDFGVDLQGKADEMIQGGSIVVLHGVMADDLVDSPAAEWQVLLGDSIDDPDFTGNGRFTIADASPDDAVLAGRISEGHFEGGPAPVPVYTAIGSVPITFHLVGARLEGTVTEESGDLKVAGGILVSDIQSTLIPAAVRLINEFAAANPGSASGMMDVLDTDGDGEVTVAELSANPLVSDMLTPDLDMLGGDGTPDALSMAMGVRIVRATF